jgi:hypothetical protein
MPVIHIEYDDSKVADEEAQALSVSTQKIVSEVTKLEDVLVYANSAKIMVNVFPIEIFVQLSEHLVKDLDSLTNDIKAKLVSWKKESNFKHLINLSVIPMKWKIEIDI